MAKSIKFNIKLNVDGKEQVARATASVRELQKVSNKSTINVSSLVGTFAKFTGISLGVSAVVKGVKELASASIEAYRKNEMLVTSFSTLLGSATQAQTLVSSLKQYGADSPYDTEGLSKAAQLMLGYGMSAQSIMPTLRQLGDIAMGDNNKLQSLALAFSQMSAAGKVCKQDLNQMVNAGFNPLQVISEQTGESIGSLTDKVSKGAISVQQIEQAFKDATSAGGKFHNMASNMSETLEGKINSMADEWANVKTQLGALVAPAFVASLEALRKTLQGITDLLGDGSVKDNNFSTKTNSAIDYARNKGNKGGSTKEKTAIYRKTLNNGITFEQKQLARYDKQISDVAKKLYNLRNPKGVKPGNWKLNNTGKYQERQLVKQQEELTHKRNLTLQRVDKYKSALTDTPYVNAPAATPSVSSSSSTSGKNRHTTINKHTVKTEKPEAEPLEGSIDWYEKQLSALRTLINSTANEGIAKTKQAEYSNLEEQLKNYKIRIGLEEAPQEEVKTALQNLYDELQVAQDTFEDAVSVEAKVKAQTKIDEIQSEIDKATKGQLSIKADVEPSYIVQGSTADKRQSYENAQTKANTIKQDYDIGLIGADEAKRQLLELNTELSELGLKPIKIELDNTGFDKVFDKIKDGWGSIQGIAGGIEGITSALDGNKNAWEVMSGVINGTIQVMEGIDSIVKFVNMLTGATQAQTAATNSNTAASTANAAAKAAETTASVTNTAAKSGEAVAEVTESGAKLPFPANIAAIAAGIAAVVGALAMVGSFATGGIVPGSSYSGDKLTAHVNSGEMILNASQQKRLFAIANGNIMPQMTIKKYSMPEVKLNTSAMGGISQQGGSRQSVTLKLKGRNLVGALANETRISSRSGRRTNIQI